MKLIYILFFILLFNNSLFSSTQDSGSPVDFLLPIVDNKLRSSPFFFLKYSVSEKLEIKSLYPNISYNQQTDVKLGPEILSPGDEIGNFRVVSQTRREIELFNKRGVFYELEFRIRINRNIKQGSELFKLFKFPEDLNQYMFTSILRTHVVWLDSIH